MKTAFDKFISLLGKCSENGDEATRLQLLASIIQSQDYKVLSRAVALKTAFQEFYSMPVLEVLDNKTLMEREKLLHKLVSFHYQLIQCIHGGNGPELTEKDLPDFISSKSISRVLSKISLSHKTTNYSNIGEEDALKLFSDTTVKSAQKCFELLPVSITRQESISEEDIIKNMGDSFFCISIDEFERIHQEFLDFAEKGERTIHAEKIRWKKHILLKIVVILLCFGAAFACSQYGLISEASTQIVYLVMLIAAILFMIWG